MQRSIDVGLVTLTIFFYRRARRKKSGKTGVNIWEDPTVIIYGTQSD